MKPFPQIKEKAFLAPMAKITDPAFRSVCKDCGAGMTTTELTSAKALLQGNEKTKQLIRRANNEKGSFAIQLFGSEPKDLADAAKLVENQCDFIDLNMGCPTPKVCKIGAGSQLLESPKKIHKIVSAMVDAVNIPISVKMRVGINEIPKNIFDITSTIEDAGASLLTIHGRTKAQAYGGVANWDIIKQIKERSSIPIVGNGDITSPEIAKERLDSSGVDYIAIGRASSGNPLLFTQVNELLTTGSYKEHTTKERLILFEKYLERSKEFSTAFILQKVQAQHFTKGLPSAAKIRDEISRMQSSEDLLKTIHKSVKDEE